MENLSQTAGPVVPHEGTWIEICRASCSTGIKNVVPHEGTWIEITNVSVAGADGGSFPTRERGLKLVCAIPIFLVSGRSPRGNVD